jgi:hypothetical protein
VKSGVAALAAWKPAKPNALPKLLINLARVDQAIPLASGDFWFSVATGIATVNVSISQKRRQANCFLIKN